ncbi:MAG: DNA internalization-related competence protein ComEC/Rec2, partial [Thiotrichales bacterium]|nr:DNA internalization-related competence protein ComEC/Rec2 [Thiotrichales bacterium]
PDHEQPGRGQVWITLLDVGQGMSAVVQTRSHGLVYDSGARFNTGFDAGSSVLLPYLRQRRITRLDTLIISHGDNDHIGGAPALLAGIPVRRVLSSVPDRIRHTDAQYCRSGQSWQWDSVQFSILHPHKEDVYRGNNASCVLQIRSGQSSILLTGDIEAAAEHRMIVRHGPDLRTDILTVPHHGSTTSSTERLLDTVQPQLALLAAGYRNRYGFPKQAIMARYRDRGIEVMGTARHGAITVNMTPGDFSVNSHRIDQPRFWYSSDNL